MLGTREGSHDSQVLDLLAEDSRLNVYAGELEVRPPGAPTTARPPGLSTLVVVRVRNPGWWQAPMLVKRTEGIGARDRINEPSERTDAARRNRAAAKATSAAGR
jgi:hypothetical protein